MYALRKSRVISLILILISTMFKVHWSMFVIFEILCFEVQRELITCLYEEKKESLIKVLVSAYGIAGIGNLLISFTDIQSVIERFLGFDLISSIILTLYFILMYVVFKSIATLNGLRSLWFIEYLFVPYFLFRYSKTLRMLSDLKMNR